jgi:AraC family transcriptional regulator, positive regulator of tynA and feaB
LLSAHRGDSADSIWQSSTPSEAHPRDRLAYWREVATKAFVRHEFRSGRGSSFEGTIKTVLLPGLGVSAIECDQCEVGRRTSDILTHDPDDIFLCLQLTGQSVWDQDGRQAVNEADSFVLVDPRRPYTTLYPTHTKSITFTIPREALKARLGNLAAVTARPVAAQSPLAKLASAYLALFPEHVDALNGTTGSTIANHALDLVALSLSTAFNGSGAVLSSPRVVASLRLKQVVEARLGDPELKPAAVAAEAGISLRYANALLSQEGTSLERYIVARRLERCRRALEDPTQMHRMISEIAYSWGFSDLSHFGRRFKKAFGISPSERRRQIK